MLSGRGPDCGGLDRAQEAADLHIELTFMLSGRGPNCGGLDWAQEAADLHIELTFMLVGRGPNCGGRDRAQEGADLHSARRAEGRHHLVQELDAPRPRDQASCSFMRCSMLYTSHFLD